MLNSNDTSNEERQNKLAMAKYTYEQVLAIQAEQVYGKEKQIIQIIIQHWLIKLEKMII